MVNTREYNNKRFSIFKSEEKTALELMNELGQACNEVLDRTDEVENLANDNKNKKVSYEDLHTKYQLTTNGINANFNGSWQGLNKPTLSEEGAFAQVEKNMADIIEINEQLDTKAKHITDYVVVDSFKIISEETYDNAFKKAIDYMKENNIRNLFIGDSDIKITQPIICDINYMGIFGASEKEQNSKITQLSLDKNIFEVKAIGVSFTNLVLYSNYGDEILPVDYITKGIFYNVEIPDLDTFITNVTFHRMNVAVDVIGRNTRIKNCIFSESNIGVNITKHANQGANNNNLRGIIIDNNNFHCMGGYPTGRTHMTCIKVNDFTINQSIKITNNYLDAGVCKFFNGYIDGIVMDSNFGSFQIYGGDKFITITPNTNNLDREFKITNNTFIFENSDTSNKINNFIYCSSDIMDGTIKNNVICFTNEDMIKIDGQIINCNITENKLINWGKKSLSPTFYNAIKCDKLVNSIISDNDFNNLVWQDCAIYLNDIDTNSSLNNNHFNAVSKGIVINSNVKYDVIESTGVNGVSITNCSITPSIDYENVNKTITQSLKGGNKHITSQKIVRYDKINGGKKNTFIEEHILIDDVLKKAYSITKTNTTIDSGILTLGDRSIWFDSTGKLRCMLGVPTNKDSDGVVVGTQS